MRSRSRSIRVNRWRSSSRWATNCAWFWISCASASSSVPFLFRLAIRLAFYQVSTARSAVLDTVIVSVKEDKHTRQSRQKLSSHFKICSGTYNRSCSTANLQTKEWDDCTFIAFSDATTFGLAAGRSGGTGTTRSALQVSAVTVMHDWQLAKVWLARKLRKRDEHARRSVAAN